MALRAAMWTVNAKKVLRHLRALGLTQPRKLKGRKWSRPVIVRPIVCNTYWEADFTYVWTGSANAYLCVVIDAWDRDIVGDIFSDRCRAREAAGILSVRLEYAGIQCPEDKPYIESFIGSYKTEEIYRNEYSSLVEARTGWESYRAWYRNDRLHQALWYKSPREYAKIARKSSLLMA